MKEDGRAPVCVVAGTGRRDRFAGPLGPLEAGIRAALSEEGFTAGSIRCVTGTMRRLSCWMEQRGVAADGLTPEGARRLRRFHGPGAAGPGPRLPGRGAGGGWLG